MNKFIIRFLKVLGTLSIILLILIGALLINNIIKLNEEEQLLTPKGQIVKVNGYNMHVYTEGEGDTPLVFMAGGGTSSPMLDFKSLYSILSEKYKIVVVEKLGYGFSDIANVPRNIESILADTRQALKLSNINGPYILFPHSMSGIEALYWAQTYPSEVEAIVGLDMALPDAYKNYTVNMNMLRFGSIASEIGVTRLFPSMSESDAMKYGTLTKDEKDLYKAIFYSKTANISMINEVKEIKSNAKKVKYDLVTNIPVLMFVSNGKGTGWNEEQWRNIQIKEAKKFKNSEIIQLNCSHYVHDIEYKKIAKDSIKFINQLD